MLGDADGINYLFGGFELQQGFAFLFVGSVELAAVGVSVSVFNLVSKLFNVPLLNITTSFVAEEQALKSQGSDDGSSQIGTELSCCMKILRFYFCVIVNYLLY